MESEVPATIPIIIRANVHALLSVQGNMYGLSKVLEFKEKGR